MKMWAIYKNFPMDDILILPHLHNGDSQGKETLLAPSFDKQTRNYDRECSNHHPSLSTLRPKRLSHSKMKWWAIHTNISADVIFRLPHAPTVNREGQETFLAPSINKPTRNYDIERSNHHPSIPTLRTNGLSRRMMKWLAVYTNLPMDVIARLAHPGSGDIQD